MNAASAWEIAIKYRIGKLPGAEYAIKKFNILIVSDGFAHLDISYGRAIKAGRFTMEHRDPFDRMLAAQAVLEDATLVTDDAAMEQFCVKCFW